MPCFVQICRVLFSQLHNHPESIQKLSSYLSSGRLSHAMLISGPEGSGVLAAALATARFLLCKTPKAGDACDQCQDCKMSRGWVHPDLTFTYPTYSPTEYSHELADKWREALGENQYMEISDWAHYAAGEENKLPNITSKETQNIIQRISKKAYAGGRKVLIIWGADLLNKEGNILLKAIEEPPENTFFILATSRPEQLLITIFSRCQHFKIQSPEPEQIEGYLKTQNSKLTDDEIRNLALFANGSFSIANWLSSGHEFGNVQSIRNWMLSAYANNISDLEIQLESIIKQGREGIKNYLLSTLSFLRNTLLCGLEVKDLVHLKNEERDVAERLAKIATPDAIGKMEKYLNEAIYHIERNASQRIVLLNLSLRMGEVLRGAKMAAA